MTLPLNFRGKQYPSIRAAALDNGLCVSSLWRATMIGKPDLAGRMGAKNKPVSVTINGVHYPSYSAAAEATGYHRTTITGYVRRLGANLRLRPKSRKSLPANGGANG